MGAESTRESRQGLAIALALATALVAVNLATSHELAPSDQGKQAQYALDLFLHGNWLVPGDHAIGEAATKPPLYTWLAGILAVLLGRIEEWILRVPAALSALGLVAVVYETGRRLAGARVALAAAILFATTHHFTKIAVLARTDGLLAFLLALQILVYLRCRETGRETLGRVVLLCALSIAAWFTKGPAGGLAALVILVHLLWMREASRAWRLVVLPVAVGAAGLGLWFACAVREGGDGVIDAMVHGEAVRHLTQGRSWNPLYYAPILPARMIPWSLLFPAVAIVVWRELRAERAGPSPLGLTLPLAWLGTMFVGFGLLPHKRPDLIYAAEPAVALLAARLLSDACPWRWPRRAWPWMTAAGIALMIVECVQDHRSATRYAYSAFGRSAREEASSRGARLVHTGFRSSAPLFHLRIAGPPSTVEEIAGMGGPILVVAPDRFQAGLVAELGPLEIVDTAEGRPGTSEPPRLNLYAPAR